MKKIFIDTNILLDVLLHREAFFRHSVQIWSKCENKKIHGFISAISMNNIHYILSKILGKEKALEGIRICMNLFSIVPLEEKIIRQALEFPFKDFEDSIQLFSALQCHADCIVTRDANHFSKDYLPVISPETYAVIDNS